jgi:hypothetical protein
VLSSAFSVSAGGGGRGSNRKGIRSKGRSGGKRSAVSANVHVVCGLCPCILLISPLPTLYKTRARTLFPLYPFPVLNRSFLALNLPPPEPRPLNFVSITFQACTALDSSTCGAQRGTPSATVPSLPSDCWPSTSL